MFVGRRRGHGWREEQRRSGPLSRSGNPSAPRAAALSTLASDVSSSKPINVVKQDAAYPGFLWQVLGPALLAMDTLECYARVLAEAAEQLTPTAALQLIADSQVSGSAGA